MNANSEWGEWSQWMAVYMPTGHPGPFGSGWYAIKEREKIGIAEREFQGPFPTNEAAKNWAASENNVCDEPITVAAI